MVLDQMGNLEVFVGHHIARYDQRPRRFHGEVFPLPTHPQMGFCQAFHRFLAVLGTFLFPRDTPTPPLQLLLSLAQKARVYWLACA